MKEKINWQRELLKSGKFNDKFSKNLLEHGAKNFMQGIYLGYMYSRWKKIRGLEKCNPVENKGQIQSSFNDFEKTSFEVSSLYLYHYCSCPFIFRSTHTAENFYRI